MEVADIILLVLAYLYRLQTVQTTDSTNQVKTVRCSYKVQQISPSLVMAGKLIVCKFI